MSVSNGVRVVHPDPRLVRLARAARRALLAGLLATLAACGVGPLPGAALLAATTAGTALPGDDVSKPATPGTTPELDPGSPSTASPASAEPPAPPVSPPTAPTLSATGVSGALSLSWTPSTDATSYVVQKRLDAANAWIDAGAALPAGTLAAAVKVPVAEWARASLRVRACNAGGCAASTAVSAIQPMAATLRYLKASNTGSTDDFGSAIALSADGDTLAVGARYEASAETGTAGTGTSNTAWGSGAVYVFVRAAGVWTQQAYLKASNTGAFDEFGTSVALSADGGTLAVGAPLEASAGTGTTANPADNSASISGAVYVFVRAAGAWSQQAYIKASNTGTNDQFGTSVALSGDGSTLAVGAIREDSAETGTAGIGADNSATDSGAVYVFVRSSGAWAQQAYLKAFNTGAGDEFGTSVALSADGNTLAVGSMREDSAETGTAGTGADNTADGSGAAYVFVRSAGVWSQQAYLKAFNTGANERFGHRIALSADGGTLAVGAPYENSAETGTAGSGTDNTAAGSGAVYVFVRSAGSWSQQAYVKASNTNVADNFGSSVALSADGATLAVGARYEDGAGTGATVSDADNSTRNAGAVYLFVRTAGAWSQSAYLKASNTGADDYFGAAVALSADGSTVAVSAPYEASAETGTAATGADNSASNSGAAYVF